VNLPNSITLARIALVPLFVYLLLVAESVNSLERWLAGFVFVLAISTDGLDGAIARKSGKVTNLGKILDPIADKALIGGSLLTLSFLGEISWWISFVIIAREALVTLFRLVVLRRDVIAASWLGKIKTIIQAIAIGAVLAPFEIWLPLWTYFETALLWLAVLATVISGFQIIFQKVKQK
jgi:CDP-diacylglycerol---glycerol-3-phosphate 3-phosphatidyltransferase